MPKLSNHDSARRFMSKIQARDPELYSVLVNKANWFLSKTEQEEHPSDIKDQFRGQLNAMPDLNPLVNPDTFGIKVAIDAIEDDKEKATDAKRLFRNTLDRAFKEGKLSQWGLDTLWLLENGTR